MATTPPPPTPVPPSPTKAKPTVAPVATKVEKPAPTPIPTETSPQAEEEQEETLTFTTPDELQDIQSYRMRILYRTTYKGETIDVLKYLIEAVKNPPAKHMIMEYIEEPPAANQKPMPQKLEIVQKENKIWFKMGDTWISGQAPEQQNNIQYGEEIRFYTSTELGTGWKKVGTEEINGFKTVHYRNENVPYEAEVSPFFPWYNWFASPGEQPKVTVKRITADVYISDKNFAVKEIIHWDVDLEHGGKTEHAQTELITEILELNPDITINIPEEKAGQNAPIPLPGEPTSVMATQGMWIYAIPGTTVENVVAYFNTELPKQGYNVQSNPMMPGMLTMTTPEGKTYTVTVTEEGNNVHVMIQGQTP